MANVRQRQNDETDCASQARISEYDMFVHGVFIHG